MIQFVAPANTDKFTLKILQTKSTTFPWQIKLKIKIKQQKCPKLLSAVSCKLLQTEDVNVYQLVSITLSFWSKTREKNSTSTVCFVQKGVFAANLLIILLSQDILNCEASQGV